MTTATSLQPGTLLLQREAYLSILKDLTIMDDIFMRNVLKDSACTEYILKVIMNQDNLKLKDQILQADYKNLQGRSSILDCIALDNSGRKYNIEFQNADSGASLKRARYHGSLVDANTLKPGQDPVDLPDTYIIFITANDTLGFNLPICHINRTFEEAGQSCPDQLHIIYVNSSFQDDTALGRLMHDLHCPNSQNMYSKILARRVKELKETQEGVDIMCDKLNELIAEERNEGILIGEAQGEKRGILIGEAQGEKRGILIGEAQGILHTQKETAKNLQHMGMALEQISQALNVSVQMIQEWVSADRVPVE